MRHLTHNLMRSFGRRMIAQSSRPAHASIHWGLLLAFLPFALLGWSTHVLMPGHDHSRCGHSHTHVSTESSSCCHDHEHSSHEGASHSHDPAGMASGQTDVDRWLSPALEDHDCQICKLLSQLRTSVLVGAVGEARLPIQTFAEWRIQNAKLSALSAYFLRGPPATRC